MMAPTTRAVPAALLAALAAISLPGPALAGTVPLDTVFTYQGQLRSAGVPVDGTVSLRFRLFNQPLVGFQVGPTLTVCNVPVQDGLFTVDLDFGPGVFEGSERWLDIGVQSPAGDCATFTALSPRQLIAAAPYAIRSMAPWETSGTFIFYDDGDVGIGTSTPDTNLEIVDGDATLRVTSTAVSGTSLLDLKGDAPSGLGSNALGTIRFLDESDAVRASISSAVGFLANPFTFSVDGVAEMVLGSSGNLGVGTTLPIARIQVDGGTDSEPGEGGYVVIGATNSSNISIDNNEIMARDNGLVSTLFLNNDGGDVSICPAGNGQVGIGTAPTSSQLTVFNSLWVTGGAQPRIDVSANGFILMDTGADIILTDGGLEVNTPSGGSTFFNRTAPDGTLISFKNDGTTAGGISVVGSTVSYNTFTGSHHAWTASPIEHGTLVTLTGVNERAHAGPNCEPVYGIAPSAVANDPGCMGAYLCPPDPSVPESRHLVASVGNGEMWVVDSGLGDIQPGDGLISSDVAGCAMLDDPARFAVGHVVARAAEPVDWATVAPGRDGVRRVLLSVFFDPFVRQGDAAAVADELEALRLENADLRQRLETLEAALATLVSKATSVAAGGAR